MSSPVLSAAFDFFVFLHINTTVPLFLEQIPHHCQEHRVTASVGGQHLLQPTRPRPHSHSLHCITLLTFLRLQKASCFQLYYVALFGLSLCQLAYVQILLTSLSSECI